MGSKRNKIKKALSPPQSRSPPQDSMPDDELMDDLFAQLDSRDTGTSKESAAVLQDISVNNDIDLSGNNIKEKKDSKSRWRARQARRAAAITSSQDPIDQDADARLAREAQDEERAIKKVLDEFDLQMHEINPDGHCLFSAVADQLAVLDILPTASATYSTTRRAAAEHMLAHPNDFLPFLPSESGEDGPGAEADGIMTPQEFQRYCMTMRDTGVWGGEPEIVALSQSYGVPIHVVQGGQPPVVVHDPSGNSSTGDLKHVRAVRISYHRYMYGLGEHYNSLRPREHVMDRITSPLKNLLS